MIGMKIKRLSFDQKKVLSASDKATKKTLMRFGAFVRTTAQRSIRKRKSISPPGQPPSSHTGKLKGLIRFAVDMDRRSVVIGPEAITGRVIEAPALLEYGGRARRKARKGSKGNTVIANYRQRPFMGPAFEKERKQLSSIWANSVK